jgi:hypothetical protein
MAVVGALVSLALIFLVLLEGFETMVLPRRVTRAWRFTRLFYRTGWSLWLVLARRLGPGKRRETCLSLFGPLSLLSLFASWILGLIVGFALLHWSLGTALARDNPPADFLIYLYLSGETIFTLGQGDVTAAGPLGRFLTVAEAGVGFGFLAMVIGYLPVLYQAFSRREVTISLLDARAGSPPSAAQFLLRMARACHGAGVDPFLAEWERWSAELLESHLSFPVLSYYRSQHDNQSWLAALTAVLDTCAVLITGVKDLDPSQALLTFAMARHAVVDLALVFHTPPQPPQPERLPPDRLAHLRQQLREAGLVPREGPAADATRSERGGLYSPLGNALPQNAKLAELRGMYEPLVNALAHYFLFALPPVLPEKATVDNWQTSAWMRRTAGLSSLPLVDGDDHFD